MKINPQISAILKEFNVPEKDAIAYLLSIYFDCRPSYTPSILVQKINVTNILGISPEREVMWNVPLFTEENNTNEKWEWVKEWNDNFGAINPKRKGSLKTCITRMKAFFAENPDIRKEEVIEATKMYFKTVTGRDYLISSHYFISKGVGKDRISALESWVEKYQEFMSKINSDSNTDVTHLMQ